MVESLSPLPLLPVRPLAPPQSEMAESGIQELRPQETVSLPLNSDYLIKDVMMTSS